MNKAQLNYILGEVQALTFANPFGPERSRIEEALLAKLGKVQDPEPANPTYTERFGQLLPWLQLAESELLKRAKEQALPNEWREGASTFAFFGLFHQLAAELDELIANDASDCSQNRALYRKVQDGVAARHCLIEGATDRIWNHPAHLFACFYQLRRAFQSIHHEIIGDSPSIHQLRMEIWESVFTKDMMSYQQWMYDSVGRFPTLVLGPSGSGKELVARAIGLSRFLPYNAKTGQFATNPLQSFYPVNLSALSETLIESELFGHRKGAFTGAFHDRKGIFSTAGDDGSVFLDEIGDVSQAIQVKLLRLLQSGEFQAIGDNRPEYFHGKIIAATHKNLAKEMQAGRLREDFYYRLCGDQVQTAALATILAEKPDELDHSVRFICRKLIGPEGAGELGQQVIETLRQRVPAGYEWPGNFRELEQAVRNCIVRQNYQPPKFSQDEGSIQNIFENTEISLDAWSRLYARKAYKNAGSYRAAANRIQIDQRTLKKLCHEHANPESSSSTKQAIQ